MYRYQKFSYNIKMNSDEEYKIKIFKNEIKKLKKKVFQMPDLIK